MEPEDKPKKVVTPAWGSHRLLAVSMDWPNDWVLLFLFCLKLVCKHSSACSAFCGDVATDLLSVSPGEDLEALFC